MRSRGVLGDGGRGHAPQRADTDGLKFAGPDQSPRSRPADPQLLGGLLDREQDSLGQWPAVARARRQGVRCQQWTTWASSAATSARAVVMRHLRGSVAGGWASRASQASPCWWGRDGRARWDGSASPVGVRWVVGWDGSMPSQTVKASRADLGGDVWDAWDVIPCAEPVEVGRDGGAVARPGVGEVRRGGSPWPGCRRGSGCWPSGCRTRAAASRAGGGQAVGAVVGPRGFGVAL